MSLLGSKPPRRKDGKTAWTTHCELLCKAGHKKHIADYPRLSAFLTRVYEVPGVADTVHFDQILTHYYDSD
jgi:glutathionyl-hydroquinone reductase